MLINSIDDALKRLGTVRLAGVTYPKFDLPECWQLAPSAPTRRLLPRGASVRVELVGEPTRRVRGAYVFVARAGAAAGAAESSVEGWTFVNGELCSKGYVKRSRGASSVTSRPPSRGPTRST